MHNWNISNNFHQASEQVAEYLAQSIKSFIDENNICHVILPGGNTPAESLRLLAKKKLNWKKVHWYLGDERCLPAGDSERNDLMLENNLWLNMPETNIHRINAELGAEDAAKRYRDEINDIDRFDIAYLGMGEDGHTASLFPGHQDLTDLGTVIAVHNSPKPPPDRVSLSMDTLRKTKIKVVLVSGQAKATVINKIKEGVIFPINSIGEINWFIDNAANTLTG